MATKAEIRKRAAYKLGILTIGQSLASQHQARIDEAYDEVYAQLKEDGLAVWASTAEVPGKLVRHVAALMAENCYDEYGVSEARASRIIAAATVARVKIQELVAEDYASQDEPTHY